MHLLILSVIVLNSRPIKTDSEVRRDPYEHSRTNFWPNVRSETLLTVEINVTRQESKENERCGNRTDERLFWSKTMNKTEIRTLQSKIMRKYMDATADPCADFHQYACGNWKKFFTIPPDRSAYDTFEIIRENLDEVLDGILRGGGALRRRAVTLNKLSLFDLLADRNDTADATAKAQTFYQSCVDEKEIENRGATPLLETIEVLGGWPLLGPAHYNLFQLLARLRLLGNDVIISQWIGPDMKNANQYIVHIDQSTLGLPSRDYFLDPKNIKYITAYKILITATTKLLGADSLTIDDDVDKMVDFETKMAAIMATSEERRNISDIYLKTDLSSMTLYFPQYDWQAYFDVVLGPKVNLRTPVAVYCVKYLLDLVRLLSNTDVRVIHNYLIWRFVRARINDLDSRFQSIKQRFNYVMYGREKPSARWQFCVAQVNAHMGMALGAMFVRRHFDSSSRSDTIRMTQALMTSFEAILRESTWLDERTKQYAKMKVERMDLKIGFPDFVLNGAELAARYYDVIVDDRRFFENVLSILRHASRAEQNKLGSDVNRTLWSTSPAVVNAYYSRNKNQIMFPAGILQPPFYHKHFPKALNFGGIGVVIGHEITHGFDDKGRLFDHQGNLMMWWRDASIQNFYEKAQCVIDQYSRYVLPRLKVPVDGFLTQGENIADNGGLKEALRAYETWLKANGEAEERLPGLTLTGRQLFFLNFAQVWCGEQKIQEAVTRMKTSVHAPGMFRIIGVLSNSQEFAQEFNCPENSPMNPIKKCIVW